MSEISNTKITRIFNQKTVSHLTLSEIEKLIDKEDISYSADYGLTFDNTNVRLIFSLN
ncbi:MAG: hypothetical protein ACP5N1_07340 [Candidatus Woesearchaeota archaeon]